MYRLICAASLAISASGCAAVDDSKKTITYDKALWKYETAIRWVDFGTANSLRRLEDPSASTPDRETRQRVKVTSYDVMNKNISEDRAEIKLTVQIVYYNDANMKLSTIIDKQVWRYDPEIKDWYISTPLPPFK